jgi:hypothetical protein
MASLDIFTFGAASYLFLIVEPKLAKRAITPGIERGRIDESCTDTPQSTWIYIF